MSRRIHLKPHLWQVQETGRGRTILLLHGAGASTHSWRDLIPGLARDHHVVALGLPGQGFTRASGYGRCGLQAMTEDIDRLCAAQGWIPTVVVGHSAGAVIALNMALQCHRDGRPAPAVIGINRALGRFEGIAGWLFPRLARALAFSPLTATAFTAGGPSPRRARRLIEATGSVLSEDGVGYYARLLADRPQVTGTMQMMARWQVGTVLDGLDQITSPCLFTTGARDKAVLPEISERARERMARADLEKFPSVGHLAHEEAPAETVAAIAGWVRTLNG